MNRTTPKDYLDVYLVCASPVDARPVLNLHHEVVRIEDVFRRSTFPVRLRKVFPPTFAELERMLSPNELRLWSPRVLHFLGHGEEDGLWFENVLGFRELVTTARLQQLLRGSGVDLVFLNACWTAGKRILGICDILTREHAVKCAIGHREPVSDQTAIAFAENFYLRMIGGRSAEEACRLAAAAVAEQDPRAFTNIYVSGDGKIEVSADISVGTRASIVDDGLPSAGYLPERRFFCGRTEEYGQISRSLDLIDLTVCGIWGIGGLGKTTIALEAAHRNGWRYRRGGITFVDVRDLPLGKRTAIDLFQKALLLLHSSANSPDPGADLMSRLKRNPGLLILDNLEDLPAAEHEVLARYLERTPHNGSRVIITGRTQIASIRDLSIARCITLTRGLDDLDGIAYVQRIAQLRGVSALSPSNLASKEAVDDLCRQIVQRTSGHPKMIELAIGFAAQGEGALAAVLNAIRGPFESQLEQMLATGLNLLEAEGQRLLPFFPLFPSGRFFLGEIKAAIHLAEKYRTDARDQEENTSDLAGDKPDWIDAGIEQLWKASLIDYSPDRQAASFHESLLSVKEKRHLTDAEILAAFVGCFIYYYQYFVRTQGGMDASGNDVRDETYDETADRALLLMEKMDELLMGATSPEVETALARLVYFLTVHFLSGAMWSTALRWQERAIAHLRRSPDSKDYRELALMLRSYGLILMESGQSEPARTAFKESSELLANGEVFDTGIIGNLIDLSKIARSENKLGEARELLEQALRITAPETRSQGICLHELAFVASAQGDHARSEEAIHKAISIYETLGDKRELSKSLVKLGDMEFQRGLALETRQHLRRAMEAAEAVDDQPCISNVCNRLADVEFHLGNPIEARRLVGRALRIEQALQEPIRAAELLRKLSFQEARQGNAAEAKRLLEESLLFDSSPREQDLIAWARIERLLGNFHEAKSLLLRSVQLSEEKGDKPGLAVSLHQLGGVEISLGNFEEAKRLYQRAIEIKQAVDDPRELAATLHQLAITELSLGNAETAKELWQQTITLLGASGDVEGRAKSMGMLGQVYANEERFDEALPRLREAAETLERIGSKDAAQMAHALHLAEGLVHKHFVEKLQGVREILSDQPGQTQTQIDQLISSARAAADTQRECVCLLVLGMFFRQTGSQSECADRLASAKELAGRLTGPTAELFIVFVQTVSDSVMQSAGESSPTQASKSLALHHEARQKAAAGDLQGAYELLEASLAASTIEGNRYNEAVNLLAMSQVLLNLGNRSEEVLQLLHEGLEIASDLGDKRLEQAMKATAAAAMNSLQR